MFLDIKVDKIKRDSLNKDQIIDSLMAHNKALRKLNTSFKYHERRINDIENLLLSKKPEEPEKPDQLEYTCKDCKYYHPFNGIGFADAVKYFECEKTGHCFSRETIGTCQLFEKEESLDEDENVIYYANNVKVDIQSKAPYVVYKTDGLLPEEYANLVSKLYYSD
jgi:hypothetical protein